MALHLGKIVQGVAAAGDLRTIADGGLQAVEDGRVGEVVAVAQLGAVVGAVAVVVDPDGATGIGNRSVGWWCVGKRARIRVHRRQGVGAADAAPGLGCHPHQHDHHDGELLHDGSIRHWKQN